MKTEDVKKKLKPKTPLPAPTAKDYLSTGSTLLNLAMTGKPDWGFRKGNYYLIVGDSQSGKTWLSLSCLAEASINPAFDGYRFIYDNGENGALMDVRKYFGRRMAERLEPPEKDENGDAVHSRYVEQLYYHIKSAVEDGRPFIYIQDSIDVLSCFAEEDKFEEQRDAFNKGKEAKGSYSQQPKLHSQDLRQILGPIQKSGSLVIFINQTRDKIGDVMSFDKKTHSGGKAITFYACIELWSSVKGKIHKTVHGKPRQIGTICQIRTKKNREQGKDRTIQIPIYWSCGMDDIGACISYLCEEHHWTSEKGGKIHAKEFDFTGTTEQIVQHVERESLERDIREIVVDVWDEIEKACEVVRKPKYE